MNPERTKLRTEVLHSLEEGNNTIAELADYVATRNVERIVDTMERLGIRYDLLARESDILHLHFWQRAFELMKSAGVIRSNLKVDMPAAGSCRLNLTPALMNTVRQDHVRSNGTVTYTGGTLPINWKLGKLGLIFSLSGLS